MQSCPISDRHRSRCLIRYAIGQWNNVAYRSHNLFTASIASHIAENTLANAQPLDARANADDRTGNFSAGRKRKLRPVLIFPAHHERIEKIQRSRRNPNNHLARARLALG